MILNILKWILIVILALFALVLYFLIVPIRFKMVLKGSPKEKMDLPGELETKDTRITFFGNVHTFFYFIKFLVSYDENGLHYDLRLLGLISILNEKKKTSEEKSNKAPKNKKKKKQDKNKTKKMKERIIKAVHLISFIFSNPGKQSVKAILRRITKLLKSFHIHFHKSHVEFGLSEPNQTGMLLGFLGTLPFMHSEELKIHPDFESDKAYFHGQMEVDGHIILGSVLIQGLSFLMDPDIKNLMDELGRLKDG